MERKTSEDAHWRLSTLPEHNLDPRMTDAKYPRPVRGIELMTRHSIYSIASMETEQSEDRTQHHKWNLKALRVSLTFVSYGTYVRHLSNLAQSAIQRIAHQVIA